MVVHIYIDIFTMRESKIFILLFFCEHSLQMSLSIHFFPYWVVGLFFIINL